MPKVTIEPQSQSMQNNPNDDLIVSEEVLEENDLCSSNDIETSSPQPVDISGVSITADLHTDIRAAKSECHPTTNNSAIETENSANNLVHLHCEECAKKEYLINTKDEIIKELRKKLKKANTKIWYLETTKRKLGASLSELKKKELLDKKACEALEV